jgi:hypothetical protein
MVKIKRYTSESLLEIFGTSRPSSSTIGRWKLSWRDTKGKVAVESFAAANKILVANDIDPLFYQHYITADNTPITQLFIAFFYEEHEVFFKLHS